MVPECVNCHDPHGDANLSMVQRELYDKAAFTLPAGPPPAEPTEQVSLVFTDDVTGASDVGDSYGDLDAPFSSVCQECHEAADHVSFKDGTSAAGANHPSTGANPGDCSSCHGHDSAFMPKACDSCHAFPPATNAHDKHVNTVGLGCVSCHPNPGGGATHNENGVTDGTDYASRTLLDIRQEVDIAFDTFNPNGAYSQAKGSRSGNGDGTCSSLYCHAGDTTVQGNGSQFPAASQGTDTTPEWNNAATGACGTCHGATAAAPPGSFAHGTHAGSAAGYSFTCNICHVNTTADGSTIASYTYHVNKEADVAFDALDNRLDGGSAYGGTVLVGDAAADAGDSCSATYCHSPGNDAAAPFGQGPAVVLQWDATSNCWSCHGNGTDSAVPAYADRTPIDGTPKGNKHTKHVTANGYGCSTCHSFPAFSNLGRHPLGALFPERAQELGADAVLDVPSLIGVSRGGPFFTDGRARTLDAVLREEVVA